MREVDRFGFRHLVADHHLGQSGGEGDWVVKYSGHPRLGQAVTGGVIARCKRADFMATTKLWTDEEISADPRVKAVFNDIRATRNSDFVNNFWRALANQPALLERTWGSLKQVMFTRGALDPLTRELIYIAVSAINGCTYCVHSHTASARAKGMSDEQYSELLSIVGMAAETNALANALQVPVDPEFQVR